MGNKSAERKCLDIVLKDSPKDEIARQTLNTLGANLIDGESPDFIAGDIGIEHFLVDLIFTTKKKKTMSIERKNSSDIVGAVDFYHQHPTALDEDISNGKAVSFIENIVNSQLNGINGFSCQKFISNFNNVFDAHYKKINSYLEKCRKVVFFD